MVRADNSFLIDLHYKEIGLEERWDTRRVERLCSLIDVTWRELASMMICPHDEFQEYKEKGSFPGPLCMLMTLIENHSVQESIPDPVDKRFFFQRNGTH